MSAQSLCDVAEVLLFDQARALDDRLRLVGQEPVNVASLRAQLGMADPDDDTTSSGADADVIVLAEWTPRDLAAEWGLV